MLRGIDPLLNPDLLHALAAMGHGDELVIADANFPAAALASRLIRMEAADAVRMLEAIMSVLPLDDFVDEPAFRMEVVGDPLAEPEICRLFGAVLERVTGAPVKLGRIERSGFYERARTAFAVVQTGERRLYGNIILRKGVVRPD